MITPRRYLFYGVTGSGKTTLARDVAERTGLPWHQIDDLTWKPGWVPVSDDEQRSLVESLCSSDAWILDHAYGAWKDIPLKRADVVVGLDYPRWVSLWRVTRRSLLRAIDKRPVCNGNVETWGQVFSRESMIVWHFRSFRRKRERIRAWAQQSPGPQVIWLRSPRQTARWLGTLERAVKVPFLEQQPACHRAGQPPRVRKAFAYITRGDRLLVFHHRDVPLDRSYEPSEG